MRSKFQLDSKCKLVKHHPETKRLPNAYQNESAPTTYFQKSKTK